MNLQKNELILVGEVRNSDMVACFMECKKGELPSTYLDLPLGVKYKSKIVSDGVKQKFKRKLSNWKRNSISEGRILALIKNTLLNLTTYIISLFRMSSSIASRLEEMHRDFLWRGKATLSGIG